MSRNLLHKNKLEAFKAWLVEQDIPFRPGKGAWQELQVRLPNSTEYAAVYSRADMPEHLTVDRRLDSLVKRFCQHKPQSSATIQQYQHALKTCVECIDQLLPYLGSVPADILLLNEALVLSRPLIEGSVNQ